MMMMMQTKNKKKLWRRGDEKSGGKKSTIITARSRTYICIYKLCIKEDYVHLLCAYVRVIASSECKHDGQWYLFCRCTFCCFFFFVRSKYFFPSCVAILFSFFPSTCTCTESECVLVGRRKIGIEEKILWWTRWVIVRVWHQTNEENGLQHSSAY